MSLLPSRMQVSDDMPMSLGKAIAREIAPKADPIRDFERGDKSAPVWIGFDMAVSSGGSAKAEYLVDSRTVAVRSIQPTSFSGHVWPLLEMVRELRQEIADVCGIQPIPQAEPKFKVGDLVFAIRSGADVSAGFFQGDLGVVKYAGCGLGVEFGSRVWWCDESFVAHLPPEPQAQEGGEWITHKPGDPCPVHAQTRIAYKWAGRGDKVFDHDCLAEDLSWNGIVAYRVIA